MMLLFLDAPTTRQLLIGEKDLFFFRFNEMDLKARHCKTISEYIEKCKHAASDFTSKQRLLIRKLVQQQDKIRNKLQSSACDWINLSLFMAMPWKLACVTGHEYEDGLPHTRTNVIILPEHHLIEEESDDLLDTLLHEQLHVYQKTYPHHFQRDYLDKNGWTPVTKISLLNNTRTNPDTNEWIYQKKGQLYRSTYNSPPSGLLDVNFEPHNHYRYEHPHELSVCDCLESKSNAIIIRSSSSSSPSRSPSATPRNEKG